jgi:hypothetical protein
MHVHPETMLAVLFGSFDILAPRDFKIWQSNICISIVTDKVYSRNASRALKRNLGFYYWQKYIYDWWIVESRPDIRIAVVLLTRVKSTKLFVLLVCLLVFNATFNNSSIISWRSVLLVEETGGAGENHRSVTDKLYHKMLYTSPWSRF